MHHVALDLPESRDPVTTGVSSCVHPSRCQEHDDPLCSCASLRCLADLRRSQRSQRRADLSHFRSWFESVLQFSQRSEAGAPAPSDGGSRLHTSAHQDARVRRFVVLSVRELLGKLRRLRCLANALLISTLSRC